MKKGTSMIRLAGVILAVALCFGCATGGQQMSPESQEAIARLAARNAGRAICLAKPEMAPQIAFVSNLLAGENSTVVVLESWTSLLSESMGVAQDVQDLMIILQGEGVIDGDYAVVASNVLPWMRMCAKAMNQGLALCVPAALIGK